jgi:serine/threonine protein kinase
VGEDEEPFLVLELLEGEDLQAMLARERRLTLATVVELVRQCALGLSAAHAAHVVHRDLKPANIFLHRAQPDTSEGKWTAKILDFGISKVLDHTAKLTQDLTVLGTPHFMAPEQARGGANQTDARADIFSLASVAFLALTGEPPFNGDTPAECLLQVCEYEPVELARLRLGLAPEVVHELQAVFRIALAKRREQRYASVAELARELASAARGALDPNRQARARGVTRGREVVRPWLEVDAQGLAEADTTLEMERR